MSSWIITLAIIFGFGFAYHVDQTRVQQTQQYNQAVAACRANHAYTRALFNQCLDDYEAMVQGGGR